MRKGPGGEPGRQLLLLTDAHQRRKSPFHASSSLKIRQSRLDRIVQQQQRKRAFSATLSSSSLKMRRNNYTSRSSSMRRNNFTRNSTQQSLAEEVARKRSSYYSTRVGEERRCSTATWPLLHGTLRVVDQQQGFNCCLASCSPWHCETLLNEQPCCSSDHLRDGDLRQPSYPAPRRRGPLFQAFEGH